jgi:hypothetical protein
MYRLNSCAPIAGSATPSALMRPALTRWLLTLLLACTGGRPVATFNATDPAGLC